MLTVQEIATRGDRILDELEGAVVGKREALELVLLGFLADGHVLVIPRAHADDIHSLDPADIAAVAQTAQLMAGRVSGALGSDGVTITQANGAAAGQTVFHYHVHVIPRFDNDELVIPNSEGAPAPRAVRLEVASKLRAALS